MSLTLIIAILVVLAVLLFLGEALFVPGFGICGICGSLCVIAADVLIGVNYGTTAAILAVVASAAAVLLFFWWFSRSKTLERMELRSTISSTSATTAQLSVKVGDRGTALTRLALIGNAEIDGKTVEVKSTGGFIDEGTPIVVTAVSEALVSVAPAG